MISRQNTQHEAEQELSERQFDAAFKRLTEIVDLSEADELMPSSPQTVYTASVVLWLLIVQRLKQGCSLVEAVQHLLETYPDLLPDNKRVKQQALSPSTAAYSGGRSRLTIDVVMWLTEKVSQSLIDASPPSFQGRRVFLLDGTTITLQPESELRELFPPATNQHGESPWPMVHLVVAHELESGAALPPEVGPKYGDQAVSETSLINDHLRRIPDDALIVADSNYGTYRVAQAATQADNRFLLRMTNSRFQSLQRQATLIDEGPNWQSYEHVWRPTANDLGNNPQIPKDAELTVRLHEIQISDQETLCLVTDLSEEAEALAELYTRRWDVEVDIRNLKVVLDIENIRAKSVEMFRKELMTSVVAYNLCSQFRRQAADAADVRVRRLSFTRCWSTFQTFLLKRISTEPSAWREQYGRALDIAKQHKLPHRPDRSYRREAYQRRPKSAHFEKRIPPWNRDNKPK